MFIYMSYIMSFKKMLLNFFLFILFFGQIRISCFGWEETEKVATFALPQHQREYLIENWIFIGLFHSIISDL